MLKRILMNAADQGGGGTGQPAGGSTPPAAAPPSTPAPANPPQAQGAPQVDPALVAAIATAVTGAVKDSVFAEARRSGLFPQGKNKPAPTPADNGTPAPAPAPDLSKLRALDRVLNRTGLATSLSDQQHGRLERDYLAEAPDNVDEWVKAYFPGTGGGAHSPQAPASPASVPAATPAAASNPAVPQPGNALPVSDRGSPPVPSVPLEERQILKMTPAEREELVRTKGATFYTQRLMQQVRAGVRVNLKA